MKSKTLNKDSCYYCHEDLGFNSWRYEVRKAIKPKRMPYRWKVIGYACESCSNKHPLQYEYGVVV